MVCILYYSVNLFIYFSVFNKKNINDILLKYTQIIIYDRYFVYRKIDTSYIYLHIIYINIYLFIYINIYLYTYVKMYVNYGMDVTIGYYNIERIIVTVCMVEIKNNNKKIITCE